MAPLPSPSSGPLPSPSTEEKLSIYLTTLNEQEGEDYSEPAFLEDEEEALFHQRKAEGLGYIPEATLMHQVEEASKQARKNYAATDVRSSRFLTTQLLLQASPAFLGRFSSTVAEGVETVRSSLARNSKAEVISKAINAPDDSHLQNEAYKTVYTEAQNFMESKSYRGVERLIVVSLITNELIGFGPLDPLWRDPEVDEIICSGPKDVQIEIKGKMHKVPGAAFRDKDHLNNLIERLYGAINKQVSRMTPIVDGRLHDNSRMAVVHESIAPMGPNFTIRRHKDEYTPPERIISWGAASPELMTYLGNLIYKGCSILVIGRTGSGKTTLLAALSGFFREDHRIITLEDNLELKLAPHKLCAAPMECLPARADQLSSGITMRDLVKASLRQRPNVLVVGEVRDEAAFDLCQALNTGHYGMSTVHANNEHDAIYRLVSMISQGGLMGGDAALPLIAASFDVIVRVEGFPYDGSRKIVSVSEVAPYPERDENGTLSLPVHPLWTFQDDGIKDGKVTGHWDKVGELSAIRREFRRLDLEEDLSWDELRKIAAPPKEGH